MVSGACGLVYEVVWVRLAMALFGTTTPSVSTVLSVFMAGLALGSWGAGRLARRLDGAPPTRFLRLYAAAELVVAVSALTVPGALALGRQLLLGLSRDTAWSSAAFLASSGGWVALTLLPYCIAMGATFPLAMAALRAGSGERDPRSFGYLYAANVLGATLGVLLSAFVLIELLGFRHTLLAAAAGNALLAIAAWVLASRDAASREAAPAARARAAESPHAAAPASPDRALIPLLFTTGFVSMALEVVWVRMLTPFLGTVVYAFASILALYLAATFAGSWAWRFRARTRDAGPGAALWLVAAVCALLTLAACDPRLPFDRSMLHGAARAALALAPFCAVVGFLTPRLVDLASAGDPERAGRAYAVNVLGSIVGPLAGGFVLLPLLGERGAALALALPLFAIGAGRALAPGPTGARRRASGAIAIASAAALAIALVAASRGFETTFARRAVLRDYEATVIAAGAGLDKQLLVNGIGITSLTPITKMMVHLPLALRGAPPRDALVICFGMGTSFRSAMSWGIPVTAVDLVPSVPRLFGFFHRDGPGLLRDPRAHVVIDDGRRFLERSRARWDLIVVDPPPPIEAAGTSLLYSREFCALVRAHLRPGGVFQQWIPRGDPEVVVAIARALHETFPVVRVFLSVEGWGLHILASDRPIGDAPGDTLAARLPEAARRDLLEWWPRWNAAAPLARVVRQEVPFPTVQALAPGTPAISDDRPVNEYFMLRRLGAR
jgi:spermidine synthase